MPDGHLTGLLGYGFYESFRRVGDAPLYPEASFLARWCCHFLYTEHYFLVSIF